jgi:hypothetical protein
MFLQVGLPNHTPRNSKQWFSQGKGMIQPIGGIFGEYHTLKVEKPTKAFPRLFSKIALIS